MLSSMTPRLSAQWHTNSPPLVKRRVSQKQYTDVPWGKMQGIRNVLVHEYFRLDEEILWQASQEDIPPLIAALEKIIQSNL